jgi:hypothetical protein
MGLPSCAANGYTEKNMRGKSRTHGVTGLAVKHRKQIMSMNAEESAKQCYERQKGNMTVKVWAKGMDRSRLTTV